MGIRIRVIKTNLCKNLEILTKDYLIQISDETNLKIIHVVESIEQFDCRKNRCQNQTLDVRTNENCRSKILGQYNLA